jgi:hypothetical protein
VVGAVLAANGEAIPIMGGFGGPLRRITWTKMLAPALRTYAVTMICETLSNVHATNPLCGWTRCELAMRVTRPVGRIGDHCTGKVQCWGGTGLAILRMARGGLTTPGRPLTGGRIPDLGEQDGAVAVSLVLSRPVPQGQSVDGSAGVGASGYRCATPAG